MELRDFKTWQYEKRYFLFKMYSLLNNVASFPNLDPLMCPIKCYQCSFLNCALQARLDSFFSLPLQDFKVILKGVSVSSQISGALAFTGLSQTGAFGR